jgi:Arc/MetJ-type ribon-helix-helix transcriptional regulator
MSTLSVPLTPELEKSVNELVKSGYGSNKADVVRRAITMLAEEEAVQTVLRAKQEINMGKGLSGDLRELAKKIK